LGRISITGTLGYDLSYIRLIPTPTGRKNSLHYQSHSSRSAKCGPTLNPRAFNLTAGELDLNESDKSKSTGVLYPAAQLVIDKEGQLQIDLNQNAWKLVDLIELEGNARR